MRLADPVAQLAKERFDREVGPQVFENILLRCVCWGAIIKLPDLFFLAEPVWTDGKSISYSGEGKPNCWYVHWVSGYVDIMYFLSLVTPTKYFGYERRGKVKIWKWEQGIRK